MLSTFRNVGHTLQRKLIVIVGISAMLIIISAISVSSNNVFATNSSPRERQIQNWIADLSQSPASVERHTAQAELEKAGEAAVDPLIAALRSSDPTLRRNATEMLGYIASPRAVTALRDVLLNGPDASVRSEAALSLSELNLMSTVAPLERAAVLDPDLQVRQAATEALAALRSNMADRAKQDERTVRAFAVSSSQPSIVYLGASDTILQSRDGGKTWHTAGKTPSRVMTMAVSPANPGMVYVGSESLGLYRSMDGGATWHAVSNTLGEAVGMPVAVTAIAIDPQNANTIYAAKATWIGTSHVELYYRGVMKSNDGGATWQVVNFPKTNEVVTRLWIENQKLYGVAGEQVLSVEP